MNNLYDLLNRTTVPIYTKLKPSPSGSQVVNYRKEKLYDYYECDYCRDEIRITEKKQEMTGGIVIMPYALTKKVNLKLALCNKCLNPVLKKLEGQTYEQ